jgi:hypothetical protein
MNACVIMHDMIIENKHDQELDYSFNELMEQYVHVQRREDRIAKFFFESYHSIRDLEVHNNLQSGLMDKW